jgi:hypothetical protein
MGLQTSIYIMTLPFYGKLNLEANREQSWNNRLWFLLSSSSLWLMTYIWGKLSAFSYCLFDIGVNLSHTQTHEENPLWFDIGVNVWHTLRKIIFYSGELWVIWMQFGVRQSSAELLAAEQFWWVVAFVCFGEPVAAKQLCCGVGFLLFWRAGCNKIIVLWVFVCFGEDYKTHSNEKWRNL